MERQITTARNACSVSEYAPFRDLSGLRLCRRYPTPKPIICDRLISPRRGALGVLSGRTLLSGIGRVASPQAAPTHTDFGRSSPAEGNGVEARSMSCSAVC
jgi:hypothetical protein